MGGCRIHERTRTVPLITVHYRVNDTQHSRHRTAPNSSTKATWQPCSRRGFAVIDQTARLSARKTPGLLHRRHSRCPNRVDRSVARRTSLQTGETWMKREAPCEMPHVRTGAAFQVSHFAPSRLRDASWITQVCLTGPFRRAPSIPRAYSGTEARAHGRRCWVAPSSKKPYLLSGPLLKVHKLGRYAGRVHVPVGSKHVCRFRGPGGTSRVEL